MAITRYTPLNINTDDRASSRPVTPPAIRTDQHQLQAAYCCASTSSDDESQSTGIITAPVIAIASIPDMTTATTSNNNLSSNSACEDPACARDETRKGNGVASIRTSSRARNLVSMDTPDATNHSRLRGMVRSNSMRRSSIEDLVKRPFSPATHELKHSLLEKSPAHSITPLLSTATLPSVTPLLSVRPETSHIETARCWSSGTQTKRLWRLAAGEWLLTALLCASFAGVLLAYHRKFVLSSREQVVFNAITTMLTFLLGVSLSSSMRSYAKLLRWLLLSLCWQPLETFDLTLGCDSLLNVCKLAWAARKHASRRLKWTTIAFCVLWFSATLALTLFISMVGLTYSVIPSYNYVDPRPGKVLIRDWSKLDTGNPVTDLGRIQASGVQGINHGCNTTTDCYARGKGRLGKRLGAWNPEDPNISLTSRYEVYSFTLCEEHLVLSGGNGTLAEIVSETDGGNWTIDLGTTDPYRPHEGGLLAMSNTSSAWDVGRLVSINTFLASGPDNPKAQFFRCNNTVPLTQFNDPETDSLSMASDEYQFSDSIARMLAGAIGWTGAVYYPGSTWQFKAYQNFSLVTAALRQTYGNGPISAQNMSDFISFYTIRVLNDQDFYNANQTKLVMGRVPFPASQLVVDWMNATFLLAGIPALQLTACIIVFVVANRAIIKDDSPLSIAKLYWSLLQKHNVGDKACMLKGDELVELIGESTKESMGPMVTYGWKDSGRRDDQWRTIGHLDVYLKGDEYPGSVDPDGSLGKPSSKVKNTFWGGIKYD